MFRFVSRAAASLFAAALFTLGVGALAPIHAQAVSVFPVVSAANTAPAKQGHGLKGNGKTASAKLLTTCPCFNYAKGQQGFTSNYPTTIQGKAYIGNPYVYNMASGNHTLMELAVSHHETSGHANTVEFGYTKDAGVCGQSTSPCMFVFDWVNDVPQGYNGTGGFVNYTGTGASPYHPGDSLSALVGTAHTFGIQLDTANNNVWAYFNATGTNQWVGYWPATKWTAGGFTMTNWDTSQPFTEIADVATDHPCSDGPTGTLATTSAGAYWTSMAHNTGATAPNYAWSVQPSGITAELNAATVSATTGRLDGPGWDSSGTGVGTAGAC